MANPATFEGLVEAITELVVAEIARAQGGEAPPGVAAAHEPESPRATRPQGPKLLVVPGSSRPDADWWQALFGLGCVVPTVYLWNGFRRDQLPEGTGSKGLRFEGRNHDFGTVVSDYAAVCLIGPTLPQIGSLGSLGAGGSPPAALAIEAIAQGRPVFVDREPLERLTRHSSRLPSGFVRRVEEMWRLIQSFGLVPVSSKDFGRHLSAMSGSSPGAAPATGRGGGRDVVTAEDVEAVRQSGATEVAVTHGTIVTALARQKALEWGMEIRFR